MNEHDHGDRKTSTLSQLRSPYLSDWQAEWNRLQVPGLVSTEQASELRWRGDDLLFDASGYDDMCGPRGDRQTSKEFLNA